MNAFEQGKKKPEKTAGDNQWVTAHQKSRTDKRPRRDGPAESRSRWEKKNSRICLSSQSRKNILIG